MLEDVPQQQQEPERIVRGYYAGVTGLAVFQMQTDLVDQNSNKREFDFSAGYGFVGALGYQISEPWRIELEVGHRTAEVASIIVGNVRTDKGDGTYSATSAMVNGYLDIGRGEMGDIQPYLGLGIGAARVTADGWTSPQVTMPEIDKVLFAYQLMGGISYRIQPKLKLSLEYRWFGTAQPDSGVPGIAGETELEYQNHNFGIGLRYLF